MKPRTRYYLGRKHNHVGRVVFTSTETPTERTFPMYVSVIGPFRTKRAAIWAATFGNLNPHFQHVRDAERLSKTSR